MIAQSGRLISIIVPSYNSSQFMAECIDSVLAQTYESWELIIVDGGSTDDTKSVVESYARFDARVRLVLNPDDDGPAQARAVGIEHSKGAWLAFIDSDDVWLPDKLERQYRFMSESGIGFSFTGYRFLLPNGDTSVAQICGWKTNTFKQYLRRRGIANSTVMLKRECVTPEVLNTVGKSHGEDTLWWLMIMRSGYIAYCLREPLTYYRKVEGSLSSKVVLNQTTVWHSYRNELGLGFWSTLFNYSLYLIDVAVRRARFWCEERFIRGANV